MFKTLMSFLVVLSIVNTAHAYERLTKKEERSLVIELCKYAIKSGNLGLKNRGSKKYNPKTPSLINHQCGQYVLTEEVDRSGMYKNAKNQGQVREKLMFHGCNMGLFELLGHIGGKSERTYQEANKISLSTCPILIKKYRGH